MTEQLESFKVETSRRQTTWPEGNEGEEKPRRLESGAEFASHAESGRSEKTWGTKEEAAKGTFFLLTPSIRWRISEERPPPSL